MIRQILFKQNIENVIRRLILIVTLLLTLTSGTPSTAFAQGGCLARPGAAIMLEDEVIHTYPIVRAMPEGQTAQTHSEFVRQTLIVDYTSGQQVWLTSYNDRGRLGDLCTDDLAQVVVMPSGKVWQHDFRSLNRETILPIEAVDITELFVPGMNTITLTLTDITSPAASTSGYTIVIVADSSVPTPIPPTATQVVPTQTPQPTPTPTRLVTATLNIVLRANETVVEPSDAPLIKNVIVETSGSPDFTFPLRWLGIMGVGLLALLGLGWWWKPRTPTPPGQITVLDGTQVVHTSNLASFGKSIITLGGAGADIVLPDDTTPPLVARISAQATLDGEYQAIWELLDPEDSQIVDEEQPLQHGDEVPVYKQIRLEYSHYQEETTTSFLEGEYNHV